MENQEEEEEMTDFLKKEGMKEEDAGGEVDFAALAVEPSVVGLVVELVNV